MATTADYLNKLVEQKNALADNLVTKGVTATRSETLETLVPKVLDISGGGDIKGTNFTINLTGEPDYTINSEIYSYETQNIVITQGAMQYSLNLNAGYNSNIAIGEFDDNGIAEINLQAQSDIIYLNSVFREPLFNQYNFIADSIGTIFIYNGRTVEKTKSDKAYCSYFHRDSSRWFTPIFVSLTNDGTEYTMYYNTTSASSGASSGLGGTFEYYDQIWYYNCYSGGSFDGGVTDSSGQNRYCMGDYNIATTDDYIAVAKELLNICRSDFLTS